MGEDELATVETLKQYRQPMRTLIEKYSGQVVDSPGNNLLAKFSSVADAAAWADRVAILLSSALGGNI